MECKKICIRNMFLKVSINVRKTIGCSLSFLACSKTRFYKALFSNFVALGYKIGWIKLCFTTKLPFNYEKRACKLAITHEIAYLALKSALGF
jgi:hypothetical protein